MLAAPTKRAPISRAWAMPSADTFSVAPIKALLAKYLAGKTSIVDPFARNARVAQWTNDLNPATAADAHLDAVAFCNELAVQGIIADAVLFDPPYSPRQITELYQSIGRDVTTADTQNGRLYKAVRTGLDKLLIPGGLAISCGWNSCGFGPHYETVEILLVAHGGAHNDTIITVERKTMPAPDLFANRPDPALPSAGGGG